MVRKLYTGLILLLDIGIVGFSFLLLAYYRSGTRVIIRDYSRPLSGIMVIWIIVSIISGKYQLIKKKGWTDIITTIIKANFTTLSITLILFFSFKMFYYSRYIVLGTIALATLIEILLYISIYYTFKFRELNKSYSTRVLVTKSPRMEKLQAGKFFELDGAVDKHTDKPYAPNFDDLDLSDTILVKLWDKYLSSNPQLFDFISENIDLIHFGAPQAMIISSATYFNIEYIDKDSQHLFMNLHKINDLRRINRYFIKVNENLKRGGVFICCGETITQRHKRFMKKSGRFFGNIFYAFDFFFRRVCPKLLLFQGLYFFITKGQDRSLSETEILGRLYFCGFEVVEYKEIDGIMYFIMKKVKEPSLDENPSYGAFIKLKRVGKGGKIFNVYKIRTMHPYSEYLQEYIFNRCRVSNSGKFADDFRISSWGRIMRNYWIDEFPQFINLFKGELNLIGTRALSEHYFKQYPEDLKEMRLKYKPGLIPVYTADRAKSLMELIESERKYLNKKKENPLWVDTTYLLKALFFILTRQVKSLDTYS